LDNKNKEKGKKVSVKISSESRLNSGGIIRHVLGKSSAGVLAGDQIKKKSVP
jgi:hypothetical protein